MKKKIAYTAVYCAIALLVILAICSIIQGLYSIALLDGVIAAAIGFTTAIASN